jgi:hypothetical protein
MAHDAALIQKYIDDAYRRFIQFKNPVDRNFRAFAYLRGIRRRGDESLLRQLGISVPDDPKAPFDVNLADAEHYSYARFLASQTGDPSIKALVTGYQVKKYVDSFLGTEQSMRTNPNYPVLPPSMDAVKWGLKGVDDGLQEFKAAHGGQLGKLGDAMTVNEQFLKGQYVPKARSASY